MQLTITWESENLGFSSVEVDSGFLAKMWLLPLQPCASNTDGLLQGRREAQGGFSHELWGDPE